MLHNNINCKKEGYKLEILWVASSLCFLDQWYQMEHWPWYFLCLNVLFYCLKRFLVKNVYLKWCVFWFHNYCYSIIECAVAFIYSEICCFIFTKYLKLNCLHHFSVVLDSKIFYCFENNFFKFFFTRWSSIIFTTNL